MKQIQYGTLVICPNTYKSKHESKKKLLYLKHEIAKVQQEIMNL